MLIMDRCNLTILTEPGYENLASFLAQTSTNNCILPCYLEGNEQTKGKAFSKYLALKT